MVVTGRKQINAVKLQPGGELRGGGRKGGEKGRGQRGERGRERGVESKDNKILSKIDRLHANSKTYTPIHSIILFGLDLPSSIG